MTEKQLIETLKNPIVQAQGKVEPQHVAGFVEACLAEQRENGDSADYSTAITHISMS